MKILVSLFGIASLASAIANIPWLALGLFVLTLMAWSSDLSHIEREVDEIEMQLKREQEMRESA